MPRAHVGEASCPTTRNIAANSSGYPGAVHAPIRRTDLVRLTRCQAMPELPITCAVGKLELLWVADMSLLPPTNEGQPRRERKEHHEREAGRLMAGPTHALTCCRIAI